MKPLKDFVAGLFSRIANATLKCLRNGNETDFSREEIRFLNFGFGMCLEDVSVVRWANILQIERGIYVDVGSHDPVFCSNTLLLHKRGWRGINIDMKPDRTAKFEQARPGDFNVTAAISDREIETTMLSYPGGGTDRLALAADDDKRSGAKELPISEEPTRTITLGSILSRCPFEIPRIDYLNIDVEGHDMKALAGLDFERYRPAIITIESWKAETTEEILAFLEPLGYRMEEKLFDTLLLVDTRLPADRSKLYG
ncbi:MAG: FkbM family methyltransferase [Verrucomicrobiota bacterium]